MKDLPNLEEHLRKLIRAQGSASDITVSSVSGKTPSASINIGTKEIQFQIPEDWNPTQYASIDAFVKRLNLREPQIKICEDIAFHEVGHNRLKDDADGLGCPQDLVGKEMAIEAVTKAMIEAGRFSPEGALYLENCISDIIDNLNCSQHTHLNGLSIFFAEQAEINGGKFSPLYEAFVKLNQHLWGRKRQKTMLSGYHANAKEIDNVVADCIKEVGLVKDKRRNLDLLFNKQKWPKIFYTFARHLVKLMDQSSPEYLPGSGSSGRGYKVPAHFIPVPVFDPDAVDDPLMKRVLDKDNLKKAMRRRNENGEDLPNFIEQWQALDYYYQAEASEIWIKAETPRKGQSMPIAPIQARIFDPEKDDLSQLLFGRVLLNERGEVCFAVPRNHVEQTVRYKQNVQNYPELNIAVLDNSISMKWNSNNDHDGEDNPTNNGRTNIVPWGDQSKYHYAVLAYYGVEKALHRLGVATKTRYNLITFASQTKATGEKAYEDRAKMKKIILNPTFGNSTNINVNVLAKEARQNGSVLMTISDGEIQNWDTIKDRFKQVIADKFYVHFQIGTETQTTRDLRSWGVAVIQIDNAADMPRRAIDITKKFYQSYAAGEYHVQ